MVSWIKSTRIFLFVEFVLFSESFQIWLRLLRCYGNDISQSFAEQMFWLDHCFSFYNPSGENSTLYLQYYSQKVQLCPEDQYLQDGQLDPAKGKHLFRPFQMQKNWVLLPSWFWLLWASTHPCSGKTRLSCASRIPCSTFRPSGTRNTTVTWGTLKNAKSQKSLPVDSSSHPSSQPVQSNKGPTLAPARPSWPGKPRLPGAPCKD